MGRATLKVDPKGGKRSKVTGLREVRTVYRGHSFLGYAVLCLISALISVIIYEKTRHIILPLVEQYWRLAWH